MVKGVKAVKWARQNVEEVIHSWHFVGLTDMLAESAEKNAKNGAFWCVLVHGGRETLDIKRISRV